MVLGIAISRSISNPILMKKKMAHMLQGRLRVDRVLKARICAQAAKDEIGVLQAPSKLWDNKEQVGASEACRRRLTMNLKLNLIKMFLAGLVTLAEN
jgi:hypothetical protein